MQDPTSSFPLSLSSSLGEFMSPEDEAELVTMSAAITVSTISAKVAGSKAVVLASGSRGDLQPFIALSAHLRASGFRVLVLTNANHINFVEKFGLQAKAVLPDMEKMLQHPAMKEFMATGSLRHGQHYAKDTEQEVLQDFAKSIEEEHEAIREFCPQLILSTPLELVSGALFGRFFELPVINCGLQPFKPTRYLKSALNEPCFSLSAWQFLFKIVYKDLNENKLPTVHQKFGAQLGEVGLWPTFRSFMDDV